LADLRASGLSDAQISACGFYTETDPAKVSLGLKWRRPAKELGPCLAIPYRDREGNVNGYVRFKPDKPRLSKKQDGTPKPVKYESPKGKPNQAFFPPGTLAALADPNQPAAITEGEKKAAKGDQEGFPTIGLVGVWAWMKKRKKDAQGRPIGEPELIDDLTWIAWAGRTVYIVFDSDVSRNPDVLKAEERLADCLSKLGAKVRIVRLPDGPTGTDGKPAKMGLDDYLVAFRPDDFRVLLAEAREPQKVGQSRRPPSEQIDDPFRLVRAWVGAHANHPDHKGVAFYREQFWRWRGTRWEVTPDAEMRARLTAFSKQKLDEDVAAVNEIIAQQSDKEEPKLLKVPVVTTGLVSNEIQALAGESLIRGDVAQPFWLDNARPHAHFISLENGILDVEALLAGQDVLLKHTPLWFSPVHFPYRFDSAADCPLWKGFLARNLALPGKIGLLRRFFGYLLLPDCSLQRFLMMLGDGSNGKSVICAVLRALLGEDNVSAVPLELFGDKFRLAGTLGKLANVVPEIGELDRIAEGQLKAFVTGDKMEFERKFKTPFSTLPTARLVLATNNAPQFSDKSDGLWRRMLLLKFTVQIPAAERVAGMDCPAFWHDKGELSGILNWALAGLFQLRKEGQFQVEGDVQADVNEMRNEANPAKRFLTEFYEKGTRERDVVECEIAYVCYRDWCGKEGHHSLANVGFGREVFRAFPWVERKKVVLGERRPWCYCGLKSKPKE
jgi:putative DNA primase/helicase